MARPVFSAGISIAKMNSAGSFLIGPRLLVGASLFAGCGCVVAQAVHPNAAVLAILLAVVAFCYLAIFARQARAAFIMLSCFCAFWAYTLMRASAPGPDDISRFKGWSVQFVAVVLDRLAPSMSGQNRYVVQCERTVLPNTSATGKVLVLDLSAPSESKKSSPFHAGEQLAIDAVVMSPSARQLPWQFDFRGYLARQGIFAVAHAKHIQRVPAVPGSAGFQGERCPALLMSESGAPHVVWNGADLWAAYVRAVQTLRQAIVSAHTRVLGAQAGALLSSMVLGNRAVELPDEIEEPFRAVGLSHILAASGFNLTIVISCSLFIAGLITRSSRLQVMVCVGALIMFVCLAGPSPSVVRAAIMTAIVLASRYTGRTFYAPAALAASLIIMLAVDPRCVQDVGFQLSYLATAGIIIGVPGTSNLCLTGRFSGMGVSNWLRDATAVVLLAQLSVLPIQLATFWRIGAYFLPANLIVDPLVPIVTILGFASSTAVILSLWLHPAIDAFSSLLDAVSSPCLSVLTAVVRFIAGLPNSQIVTGPPSVLAFLFYYLSFAGLLLAKRQGRYLRPALLSFVISIFCLFIHEPMDRLTVAVFPGGVLAMNESREVFCLGNADSSHVSRFIGYFGAHLKAAAGVAKGKTASLVIPHSDGSRDTLIVADMLAPNALALVRLPCTALVITCLSKKGNRIRLDKSLSDEMAVACRSANASVVFVGVPAGSAARFRQLSCASSRPIVLCPGGIGAASMRRSGGAFHPLSPEE